MIHASATRAAHDSAQQSAFPAAGIVFLVCIILFQHLHYLDTAGALQRAFSYPPPSSSGAARPLLHYVAVNRGNALLCELQALALLQASQPVAAGNVLLS